MLTSVRSVVLWNPSAGSADQARDVRQQLERIPQLTLLEPHGRDAAIEATIRAAEQGADLVIAAGGDGTVNSVVAGILRSQCDPVLGVLPVGTGNDLARALGMPLDPLDAVRALSAASVGRLDVVRADTAQGTHVFANMLTAGNTGRYLHDMTSDMKSRWGPLCYLRGVIDVLRDLQVYRVRISCDGGTPEEFDVLNIFAANGCFSGGGLAVSPEAVLDDGQVDLVIVRDGDAVDIASLTTEYVIADYLQHDLVEFRRAAQIEITAEPQMPATADGDEIGATPVTIHVDPRRLRVLRPPEIDA
jgi:diacylglycerol kinase (ATP)